MRILAVDATSAAAWVGAFGALANAGVLWWMHRRQSRPDLGLAADYEPGIAGDDPYGDSKPPMVNVRVIATAGATLIEAGIAPEGRRWKLRRSRLPATLWQGEDQTRGLPLPRGLQPTRTGHLYVSLRECPAWQSPDPTVNWCAWVRTSTNHLYRSGEAFTLAERPQAQRSFNRKTGRYE